MPVAFCKWRKWKGWVVHSSWGVTEGCSDVLPHYLTTLKVLVSKGPQYVHDFRSRMSLYWISYNLVHFPVISWQDSAVEGVSSSSSTKDVGCASPVTDRKKHRRKKSLNQKGDATTGQADGKCLQLQMCFYNQHSPNPNKEGNNHSAIIIWC